MNEKEKQEMAQRLLREMDGISDRDIVKYSDARGRRGKRKSKASCGSLQSLSRHCLLFRS